MKKLILCLIYCLSVAGLMAQSVKTANHELAQKRTANIKSLLDLNEKQEKEVYRIQARKINQLENIESLKQSDPGKYKQKIRSVYEGNEISLQRTLNQDQLKKYHARRGELRKKKAVLSKTMKEKGASKQAISEAVDALEFNFEL